MEDPDLAFIIIRATGEQEGFPAAVMGGVTDRGATIEREKASPERGGNNLLKKTFLKTPNIAHVSFKTGMEPRASIGGDDS